jgi:hypothetical protein
MKKLVHPYWTLGLFSVNAAIAVLLAGCATHDHSFNNDFGESLPAKPMYSITDEKDDHFKIDIRQGTTANAPERVINLKEAATTIAKAEAQRLGWEKWELNYIDERDQGWMHIVIAEVKRQPYIEPNFPSTNSP